MILFCLLLIADESHWVQILAQEYNGVAEYRLFDGSRVDILNDEYAIEVEWAHKSLKWAEAIGQSIYYSEITNRKPMIILLVLKYDQVTLKNIYKCLIATRKHNIKVVIRKVQDD